MRALACLLAVVLCAAPAAADDRKVSTSHETLSFTDHTDTRTVEFDVPEGAADPRFEVTATVRRGDIQFRIVRPDGEIQADLATDEHIDVKLQPDTLARHPGTWRVRITTRNATGNYDVRFTATWTPRR